VYKCPKCGGRDIVEDATVHVQRRYIDGQIVDGSDTTPEGESVHSLECNSCGYCETDPEALHEWDCGY